GRRPTGVYDRVQASNSPTDCDGREDGGRAESRARHRAERDPQLEAIRRGRRDDGGAGEGGRGAGQPGARGLRQGPGTPAGAGPQDHGGRDRARRAGGRKKNTVVAQRVRAMTTLSMTAICAVLGIARRSAYYAARPRPTGRYQRADDGTVLQQIRAVTNSRAT